MVELEARGGSADCRVTTRRAAVDEAERLGAAYPCKDFEMLQIPALSRHFYWLLSVGLLEKTTPEQQGCHQKYHRRPPHLFQVEDKKKV